MTAKLVASTITYPHEVLRTRMQNARYSIAHQTLESNAPKKVIGLFATLRNIVQVEGVLSLWSGLKINLIRVIPATAATFLSYEYIAKYLDVLEKQRRERRPKN